MSAAGTYIVKCVKAGGLTLAMHGEFTFAEDQQIDLLDEATDDRIRAWPSWSTAHRMCTDQGLEFAQAVTIGDLVVLSVARPERRGAR